MNYLNIIAPEFIDWVQYSDDTELKMLNQMTADAPNIDPYWTK